MSEGNGGSAGEKQERLPRVTYVVFISLLIDLLAFTVILPLLPAILDFYGQKQDGLYDTVLQYVHGFRHLVGAPDEPKWNSVLFGGLIGSLFSFLQFLTSPMIGAASDYYGRRPLLLLTLLGISASYVLWALSGNFTLFVVARVVGGMSKGNISLSTAIVTDVCSSKTRGKGMALVGVAFSIGFIVGPMIGAGFSRWSRGQTGDFYVAPAIFAITLSVIDFLFVFFCFTETLPTNKRAKSVKHGFQEALSLINPMSLFNFSAVQGVSRADTQSMQKLGLVYFLYLFLYSGLEFTLTFVTHNVFKYDSMQQGKMFLFIGVIMASVQGGFVRRLRPGSELKTALWGMMVVIPSFIIVGLASTQLLLYIGLALFSFASATVVPCLTTLISSYGGDDQKGVVLGIFRSLGALARAIGPVFASTLYWSVGSFPCYTLGGTLLIIPCILLSRHKLRTQ